VRFDDRLTTVLNQPARTRHDKAVRWRQLVDLVARAGPGGQGAIFDQAIETVRAEAELVEESLRAAAARSIAALPLPVELVAIFASDTLAVSAPVLAAASLDENDWSHVLSGATAETKGFIGTLHPRLMAPSEELGELILSDPIPQPPKRRPSATSTSSLAEVVARIERRKRRSDAIRSSDDTPSAGNIGMFRWECGPGGDIEWVDGIERGALIGASIAARRGPPDEGPDDHVIRAFARRSPFRDAVFTVAGRGNAAGAWKMSGVPAFDPAGGRFAGYRGIALRAEDRRAIPPAELSFAAAAIADPASLRELVHEIKTPLNAIIGFAEIIDGQYLGPADRRYRQRAAHIVSQARLLVGAIDDLDFAAKAQGKGGPEQVDLSALVGDLIHDLRARARTVGADVDTSRIMKKIQAKTVAALAERAIRSVLLAVIDQAGRSERLLISVDRVGDKPRVAIGRPLALEGLGEEQLFGAGTTEEHGGLGIGFSLRLARGLARIAGFSLKAGERDIALLFDEP
jgi:hypothetical protein